MKNGAITGVGAFITYIEREIGAGHKKKSWQRQAGGEPRSYNYSCSEKKGLPAGRASASVCNRFMSEKSVSWPFFEMLVWQGEILPRPTSFINRNEHRAEHF